MCSIDTENTPRLDDDTLNRLFAAMADRHRRVVLYYLLDHEDEPVQIDEVIDQVVEDGHDTSQSREQVRAGLWHVHLPKLAESGLVVCRRNPETVQFDGDDDISQWLRIARRRER